MSQSMIGAAGRIAASADASDIRVMRSPAHPADRRSGHFAIGYFAVAPPAKLLAARPREYRNASAGSRWKTSTARPTPASEYFGADARARRARRGAEASAGYVGG